MVLPHGYDRSKQYFVPYILVKFFLFFACICLLWGAYLIRDYLELKKTLATYNTVLAENSHLKGEAKILLSNLDEVKKALRKVQDYTSKLDEIVNLKLNNVSEETGIGPLSVEEYGMLNRPTLSKGGGSGLNVPLGLKIDQLVFRPVLKEIEGIEKLSHKQAWDMQYLLSTLSQKKSLLSSIPSVIPVDGWITSSFGYRISPFTGKRTLHRAIDIASPVGTPIIAPADGVVIFSGKKAGFGNFIMIAHYGYGIVTRFGHNTQNMVQAGQKVKRGEQIATVGMTGRTTGPHLHYEIWVNGRAVNPKKFILSSNISLSSVIP